MTTPTLISREVYGGVEFTLEQASYLTRRRNHATRTIYRIDGKRVAHSVWLTERNWERSRVPTDQEVRDENEYWRRAEQ